MATTDLWRANDDTDEPLAVGPSDREVIEALQRIASAQAHLSLAEQVGGREIEDPEHAPPSSVAIVRSRPPIPSCCGRRLRGQGANSPRLEREATEAAARERAVLDEHGFTSFRDYLHERDQVSTTDTHLALARRESAASQAAWEQLQSAMAPTLIIDLTGEEPRIL